MSQIFWAILVLFKWELVPLNRHTRVEAVDLHLHFRNMDFD